MVRKLEREGELPALPRIGTRIIFEPKVVRAFPDGWRGAHRGRAGRPGAAVSSGTGMTAGDSVTQ